ncbi:MAG TPA: condensation domain-containing protein, partial [Thermoanaerobaculia bacterium]|nr:condensation domain-containing protein [Thermoanaerobaculia bacterium]
MSDFRQRILGLSGKQRALLELRLGELGKGGGGEIPAHRGTATEFPLSFSQQRLWFVEQLEAAESSAYNLSYAIRMRGKLDRRALRRALDELPRRQESLRVVFVESASGPRQRIEPVRPLPLPGVDLRALPAERREGEAKLLVAASSRQAFALSRWPLMRSLLLRLDEEEHVLALVVHHIVADGWSFIILVRDLAFAYLTARGWTLPPLPELPIQYRDFAVWQRGAAQAGELERQRAYWRQALAGVPTFVDFPVDRPRPPAQRFAGARRLFALAPATVAGIAGLLREAEGSTLFMVLLAAFQCLVRHYSRQDDFVVSAPISYRNRAECENLVGFFANTLLFRSKLAGDPEFREVLARVKAVVLGAYA